MNENRGQCQKGSILGDVLIQLSTSIYGEIKGRGCLADAGAASFHSMVKTETLAAMGPRVNLRRWRHHCRNLSRLV
jgi:hypothetical protein